MPAKPAPVYLLEVSLLEIQPRIWRRLLVDSSITLKKLHDILQVTMGWTDSHLHQFEVDDLVYSIPDEDDSFGAMEFMDERRVTLKKLLAIPRHSMIYTYDFGDRWQHRVTLVKIFPSDAPYPLPYCVGGENACPPEDCGGAPGYFEFVRVMADQTDGEHDSMTQWYGGDYDAKHFDIDLVNRLLIRHQKRKRKT